MKLFKKHKSLLQLFLTGFGMGSADIVPGVSGGTIAFIFGIYEDLVNSIKTVSGKTLKLILKGKFKKAYQSIPFSFLLPVFAGIFTALFSLANLISYLLENHPVYIWSFFFGLVVASIFIVSQKVTQWKAQNYLALTLSAIAAFIIVGAVPQETPNTLPAMFIAGAIAICAMILPGISGSFLLIILGKYQQILQAVLDRDVVRLITFMLGAALGLSLFSRLLSWLFSKHHNLTVAILTGFMAGSLRKIWPWKDTLTTRINSHGETVPVLQKNILPEAFDLSLLFAVLLFVGAAFMMWKLSKFMKNEDVIDS